MSSPQSHPSNIWSEPAGSGATPTLTQFVFQVVGGKWQAVAGSAPQARLLNLRGGTNAKYELIDVRTEYVLATSGAKVTPTTSATEVDVMVKSGATYAAAALSGATKAAQYFLDTIRGKLRLVPFTAPEALLVNVRGKVRAY